MSLPPEIRNNLKSRDYRLNNLYYITNKEGEKQKFNFNPEQRVYFDGVHNRNIILKARQLGFTTEQCIIQLDAALFEGAKCALIAHNLPDAQRFFREKIQFAHEHLPEAIKKANPCRNDRAGELVFSKGGSLSVSTSFRGGTLKYLHVSEFGKICAKYPDKAREIVTGAFEAVPKTGTITLESTAEGRAGYFYDYCQKAQKMLLQETQLTELDFKFFFFPWYGNPDYSIEGEREIPQRLKEYFAELESKHKIKLTPGQQKWYAAKESDLGDDIFREYPTTPEEAFKQSIEGAYYKKQFQFLYREKRIGTLPDNSHLPVYTFWDLGVGDSMSIWFVRFVGDEPHVIDYYENSGEGLRHYFKVLRDKGYKYAEHWAPHDIENRSMTSDAKSRKQVAAEGYEIEGETYCINFQVVPKVSVEDGIDAVRQVLPLCAFDSQRCEQGILCLENYRKEWDDKKGCWKDKPLHDWASHGSDAFRYFAVHSINRKEFATKLNIRMAM